MTTAHPIPSPIYIVRIREQGVWYHPQEVAPDSRSEAVWNVTEYFADHPHQTASLATVQVWELNDAGRRDLSEDVLREIGAERSAYFADDPESYPQAFADWATDGMVGELAALFDDGRRVDERWGDIRDERAA